MVDGELNFQANLDKKKFDNALSGLEKQFKGLAKAAAAAFSVKAVVNFTKATKEAYTVQEQAEVKLATVMKQRMGATDAMIDSVKELAAEQQKLGVIGDEVQLAGAQQVATYLTETESIKTLLPAMNDLLAQQQGLNASSGDAVNIANLMGKAMQGQASALRRVGITFSDAEEEVLKYGTESEKAAMLAQIITNNVGHMNTALAQTDAGKQKQLANSLGDVKEQFGQAVLQIESVFLPVVQKTAEWLSKLASLAQKVGAVIKEAFGVQSGDNSAVVADETAAGAKQAAESYDDMSKSAEKTAKAQKNQLAAFDKITKLTEDESDSSSDTGANVAINPAALSGTAKLTVDAETSEAAKKLKKFFDSTKKQFSKFTGWAKKNFGPTFDGLWDGLKDEGAELLTTLGRISSDLISLMEPLKSWLSGDFTTQLQTAFTTISDIALGLFDTFNTVFADIWDLAVFPMLTSLIEQGLPMWSQYCTESYTTLDTWFNEVKSIFDMLWADVAEPILSQLSTIFTDVMSSMKSAWDKWGAPIFKNFREAITNTGTTFKNIWNKTLKPVWDTMMSVADEVWSDHLKPLVDNFLDLVGTMINGALRIYNQAILPVVNWLNDKLGPVVKTVLKGVVTQWGNMVKNVTDYVNKVIKVWKSIVSFITDVFTGDWENAWEDVKDIFSGVCDALGTLFKAPINLIIAGFNKLLSGIEWVVNSLVDALNSISIDVPSVLQDIVGFDKFGFDLDNISIPQIPALAKGTVVPANYGSFLAVMGDNKKEPEVVSPYSTIVQAVKDAQGGAKGPMTINLYLQTRQGIRAVSSAVIDDINDITNSTGVNPVFM